MRVRLPPPAPILVISLKADIVIKGYKDYDEQEILNLYTTLAGPLIQTILRR